MSKPAVFEVAIDEIRPDPNNARRHPERNLSALAASFKRFGQQKPVVVDQDGVIIAGSGWWMAMKAAGAKKIIISRSALTGPERTAYAIADNRTAELSEWDTEILGRQLDVLGDEFKDAMLFDDDGSTAGGGSKNPSGDEEPLEQKYTAKIKPPIYEPKMKSPPPIAELRNRTKADALIAEIRSSKLDSEVEKFLIDAAERHVRFSYSRIAEWYCHAPASTKRLMENSGLVIIDFDRAIENGFVKLTNTLLEIADRERSAALESGESDGGES
jgi:hypothetical protein